MGLPLLSFPFLSFPFRSVPFFPLDKKGWQSRRTIRLTTRTRRPTGTASTSPRGSDTRLNSASTPNSSVTLDALRRAHAPLSPRRLKSEYVKFELRSYTTVATASLNRLPTRALPRRTCDETTFTASPPTRQCPAVFTDRADRLALRWSRRRRTN